MTFAAAKAPTRRVFAERMTQRAEDEKDFVVFESDLAKSTYSFLFKDKYPERYFNMGIAEIGTVASAAGMAAFALAAAMYVATGLLIAWAGAALEKKARILR